MLNLEVPEAQGLSNAMLQMGQVPMAPPNVKGWPGGRMWINTSTVFVRYNTCVYLAGGTMPGTQGIRFIGKGQGGGGRTGPEVSGNFRPGGGGSAQAIIEEWLTRLIQRPVEDRQKQILLEAMEGRTDERSVRNMIQLIMSMPEYQLC